MLRQRSVHTDVSSSAGCILTAFPGLTLVFVCVSPPTCELRGWVLPDWAVGKRTAEVLIAKKSRLYVADKRGPQSSCTSITYRSLSNCPRLASLNGQPAST